MTYIQKMKASGFNTVAFYFAWGYHSPAPGVYDFSGIRNVERALEMAEEEGMYIIARTGPYINSELSGGGYPGWMFRNRAEARTDDPVYLAAADEWMTHINAIIARHQITTGESGSNSGRITDAGCALTGPRIRSTTMSTMISSIVPKRMLLPMLARVGFPE